MCEFCRKLGPLVITLAVGIAIGALSLWSTLDTKQLHDPFGPTLAICCGIVGGYVLLMLTLSIIRIECSTHRITA